MKSHNVYFAWRLLVLASIILGYGSLFAEEAMPMARPMRVAIRLNEPFTTKNPAGGYSGYAIDLWEKVAAENGWKFEYVPLHSSDEILEAICQGKADVGAANITVTHARLNKVDFSLPFMDAGLQIMVDDSHKTSGSQVWRVISNPEHLKVVGFCTLIIICLSVLVTLFERHLNPDFPKVWIDGLVESFYHVMSVVFTGKTNHPAIPGRLGRFFAAVWVATGVAVVAFITSSITSVMTVNRLHGEINGPQDLPGKTVGTIRGTLGQTYCENLQLNTQLFDSLPEAVHSMLRREINCIVYDAPVLQYYDNAHPELPISEVGPIINRAPYAFVFPQNSSFRTPFNRTLFALQESGFIGTLRSQYFGSN